MDPGSRGTAPAGVTGRWSCPRPHPEPHPPDSTSRKAALQLSLALYRNRGLLFFSYIIEVLCNYAHLDQLEGGGWCTRVVWIKITAIARPSASSQAQRPRPARAWCSWGKGKPRASIPGTKPGSRGVCKQHMELGHSSTTGGTGHAIINRTTLLPEDKRAFNNYASPSSTPESRRANYPTQVPLPMWLGCFLSAAHTF